MPKKTYRVRNWKHYNRSLVQRGSLTLWVSEDALHNWYIHDKTHQPGRPQEYSDQAILCALSLKAVYHLPFRGVQGFLDSLLEILKTNLKAPLDTLLCKRQKHLRVDLPKGLRKGEGLHIVVDSTGLKVFGEGEWKVRQHGYVTKRLWRTLHLAINSKSQMIEASELTELKVQDCEGFSCLLDAIEGPLAVMGLMIGFPAMKR